MSQGLLGQLAKELGPKIKEEMGVEAVQEAEQFMEWATPIAQKSSEQAVTITTISLMLEPSHILDEFPTYALGLVILGMKIYRDMLLKVDPDVVEKVESADQETKPD